MACDRCGEKYNKPLFTTTIITIGLTEYDLCDSCKKKLRDWLNGKDLRDERRNQS